jgi:hypothetical protein
MVNWPRKNASPLRLRHLDLVKGALTFRRVVLTLNGLRDASGRLTNSAVEGVGVRSGWQKRTPRTFCSPFLEYGN